jgi:hypothetical protein
VNGRQGKASLPERFLGDCEGWMRGVKEILYLRSYEKYILHRIEQLLRANPKNPSRGSFFFVRGVRKDQNPVKREEPAVAISSGVP